MRGGWFSYFAMRLLRIFTLGYALTGPLAAQIAQRVPAGADPATLPADVQRDLQACTDPWYARNFGNHLGFRIEHGKKTFVEVTPGQVWQADRQVIWYPPTIPTRKSSRPALARFN